MRLLKLLLVLLPTAAGACNSSIEHLCFSPDGTKVAYVTSRWALTAPYLGALVFSGESLNWCEADTPNVVHTKHIASGIDLFGATLSESVLHLMFAPDSKHLVVYTTKARILIVDTATGKMWRLRPPKGRIYRERITWGSNVELVYITETRGGNRADQTSELRIFRHNIFGGDHAPVQIYYDQVTGYYGKCSWSPNGRFVLLGPFRARSTLLDTQTRRTLHFAPDSSTLQNTSWKRDSSAALCAVERTFPTDLRGYQPLGYDLFLVNPLQWSAKEVGVGRVDRRVGGTYRFAPEWTADGTYVVHDSGWSGCALISPEPWVEIALKDRLLRMLNYTSPPNVSPLPVPGWVWTNTLDGTYAVDYSLEKFILITKGIAWAISPDGARIAQVSEQGKVTIRELKLPNLGGGGEPRGGPAAAPLKKIQQEGARTKP